MPSPADLSYPQPSLIIGADGFLGRNVTRYFAERGWPVHAIGRADGDLSDRDTVDRLFKTAPPVARIFHLVTRQRTGQVQFGIQGELLTINARIHLNVLEAWQRHQPQAKLISTGSSCAYPEMDRPIAEDAFQTGPMHPSVRGYGLAKQVLAEGSAVYAEQYGLKYLHCLLATLYGPFDHKLPDRTHFMTAMIDRAVAECRAGAKQFEVWGDPATVRDLLYVDDQIEAILLADGGFANTLLNVASNGPVTIGAVAAAIVAALDWPAEIIYPPGTFKGAGFKSIDATRFLAATGWQPRIDLETGIRMVLRTDYQIG
ncbi:MAG TPA: NAD-dependent epimerase/dehydratase family protein [Stellaceae bacterium]|nr:NAD-dependent epimerase/dehydratase family protein [Stellaceae bacterium]